MEKETCHKRILEWLKDGEWHCGSELSFMKDDRKRISELILEQGYNIKGDSCDGRCGIVHKSRNFKMRRLVGQDAPTSPKTAPPRVLNPEDEEIITEDILTDMFGEGGKEEIKGGVPTSPFRVQEVISALKEQTLLFK